MLCNTGSVAAAHPGLSSRFDLWFKACWGFVIRHDWLFYCNPFYFLKQISEEEVGTNGAAYILKYFGITVVDARKRSVKHASCNFYERDSMPKVQYIVPVFEAVLSCIKSQLE